MKISSIKNLEKLSNKIKKKISTGDTILLYGEIGVGKTTFARLFINNFEKYNKLKDISNRELFTVIPITFFVFLFGVYPAPLVNIVAPAMQNLIEIVQRAM